MLTDSPPPTEVSDSSAPCPNASHFFLLSYSPILLSLSLSLLPYTHTLSQEPLSLYLSLPLPFDAAATPPSLSGWVSLQVVAFPMCLRVLKKSGRGLAMRSRAIDRPETNGSASPCCRPKLGLPSGRQESSAFQRVSLSEATPL